MKTHTIFEALPDGSPRVVPLEAANAFGTHNFKSGVTCPHCGGCTSEVTASRGAVTIGALTIRRRRICGECAERFTTFEFTEQVMDDVIEGATGPTTQDAVERIITALRTMVQESIKKEAVE